MSKHKRSAAGYAHRQARRNMYASLLENCYGKEAGRPVTTVWGSDAHGQPVPVGVVDQTLLKPERVHGGVVSYDVDVDKNNNVHLTGGLPDEDEITCRAVNKRASRLSQDFRCR
jgi:hypothetical protein